MVRSAIPIVPDPSATQPPWVVPPFEEMEATVRRILEESPPGPQRAPATPAVPHARAEPATDLRLAMRPAAAPAARSAPLPREVAPRSVAPAVLVGVGLAGFGLVMIVGAFAVGVIGVGLLLW